ncbi:MAG: hypothetical protein RLZZ46_917, partial [Bacteroidota bacterium]
IGFLSINFLKILLIKDFKGNLKQIVTFALLTNLLSL